MAIPQHQFLQQQQSGPINFYNSCSNLVDQTYPQYIPPFHVPGLAPGDVFDGGLSLDDRRNVTSGETPVYSFFDDEMDREFQRQDAEIDHFVKVQGERLRQSILENVQANQFRTIALAEERIAQKLIEKEAEVEHIDNKNNELEEQIKQLIAEADEWKHRAKLYENFIDTLKSSIRLAQNRDVKEGCGDSEVDDTTSYCNYGAIDFHLIGNTNTEFKESMTCKVCKVNQVCMLLLPCRHLCLCKDCESKLSFCPLCQCSKFIVNSRFDKLHPELARHQPLGTTSLRALSPILKAGKAVEPEFNTYRHPDQKNCENPRKNELLVNPLKSVRKSCTEERRKRPMTVTVVYVHVKVMLIHGWVSWFTTNIVLMQRSRRFSPAFGPLHTLKG
ncbi:hypothetical protein C5167_016877 [Papaver somniferum]|uniref:RING-type domain-containing protein n=1 Tax=Papaver somniferum TaxID=3469 RepID=A0A4Y7ILV9_PAPSO|nr:hypothetical protein C5167_016877 [Papaver somniferum]